MIMAKNDGMDALSALLGLGILGAIVDDTKEVPPFVRDMQRAKAAESIKTEQPKQKPTPADGAKVAKEMYDAYVQAGFTEVQAFDLLKCLLTNKR